MTIPSFWHALMNRRVFIVMGLCMALCALSGCIDFETEIYQPIVETKCMQCHVPGGVSGATSLVFVEQDSGNIVEKNQQILDAFLLADSANAEMLLNKVRGISGHGGGVQLQTEDEEYAYLAAYVASVVGGEAVKAFFEGDLSDSAVSENNFFDGVSMESADSTLRRASILITGEVPAQNVLESAKEYDLATLREVIRSKMQGSGFHAFLKRAANDRLLTEKFLSDDFPIPDMAASYPYLTTLHYQHRHGEGDFMELFREIVGAFAQAPLELIAHIVEKEKPYTEVLTANYTMVNWALNDVYESNVEFSTEEIHSNLFKPAKIEGYVRDSSMRTFSGRATDGFVYDGSGIDTQYPHAGILNDPAFLRRYPSTATNRNRARARWTYYHFLGHDIEASAMRSTNAEDLNDIDDPTQKNSACTVCHFSLDPLAGAFQNYGDQGLYRDSPMGGLDALPVSYKYIREEERGRGPGRPPYNPEYQYGDTWYSDMPEPGFESVVAPSNDNSLQWLAGEISKDDRFAVATVKFWWESIMGRSLDVAPIEGDLNYETDLVRYQVQSQLIEELADRFKQNFSLKELLLDMLLSDWFRASTANNDTVSSDMTLLKVGLERLLTPEELTSKLVSLSGYSWESAWSGYTAVSDENKLLTMQRLNYGGIDSNELIVRARELSALMTGVTTRQALEASCPIVINEFKLPDAQRKLLGGITSSMLPTPQYEQSLKLKLVELHRLFWNEKYLISDNEINESYMLLQQAWGNKQSRNSRGPIQSGDMVCNGAFQPIYKRDSTDMLSAWRMIVAYLLMDYRFLHE